MCSYAQEKGGKGNDDRRQDSENKRICVINLYQSEQDFYPNLLIWSNNDPPISASVVVG